MKLRTAAIAGTLALAGVAAGTAAPAAQAAPPKCVVVYDFPDMGLEYCYDVQSACLVTEKRTTFIGTQTRCVVRNPIY